ncbi:MAG: hypothetical protein ABFD83_13835 [Armatimonadota bacterium]
MPRGGARPGAGRKKRQPDIGRTGRGQPKEHAKQAASEHYASQAQGLIDPHIPDLISLGLELANGVYYEHPQFHKVYKTLPNLKAIIYLMDRVCGRPVQQVSEQVTVEAAESLINKHGQAVREVLDDEYGAEVSTGLCEKVQARFEELLAISEQ